MTDQVLEAEVGDESVTKEHANLSEALVAAQKEMPAVDRDSTNPHFKSKFTSLDNLLAKVRPVLNRHGVAVVQMPSQDDAGKPTLVTRLVHTSGEAMESTMPLLLAKSDPQGLGSALTYSKRYALSAALAIADQEDDDGNGSDGSGVATLAASAKQLGILGSALNWLLPAESSASTWDAIKAQCGGEISGPVANAVIATIKARKDAEPTDSEPEPDAGEPTDGSR
jgi:ERF superfamily